MVPSMIAYLTDVEGRWDKLASFASDNPHISLIDGRLRLADGVVLVFGGDAIDRGPHGRRIVETLLAARLEYGERVVLLAGNRDINKLRLWRELAGAPPARAPRELARGDLLRWIFANTMGARDAFVHRATELEAEGRAADDESVVQSYLDDLAPGGPLRRYLALCRLSFRSGVTAFFHGGVTSESFGVVPSTNERFTDVDAWTEGLNRFYADEIRAFEEGSVPQTLIAYQAPRPGTHRNDASVVYARPADDQGNPLLPDVDVVDRLRASGVRRVVVGHTPSGDCPAVVRDADFELVLADNSYGRVERGSQVFLTDDAAEIRGTTELDDGTRAEVHFRRDLTDDASPLGKRDRTTGELVKARLADGDYLLFRGLPAYRTKQTRTSADDLARRPLAPARY
jgi:hypothetical protein